MVRQQHRSVLIQETMQTRSTGGLQRSFSVLALTLLLGLAASTARAEEATAPLTVTKRVDGIAAPGSTVSLVVTVANTSDAALDDVRVRDVLPEGFSFKDTGSQERLWTLGAIDAGAENVVTYDAVVADDAAAGTYESAMTVTASGLATPVTATATLTLVDRETAATLAASGASLADLLPFFVGGFLVLAALAGFLSLPHTASDPRP